MARFLSLFTFLPAEEIRRAAGLCGAELNQAKEILAFEATCLAHGRDSAVQARAAAARVFGMREIPEKILPSSGIPREKNAGETSALPCTRIPLAELEQGIPAYQLFHRTGLAKSAGEARRLINQGGAFVNGNRVDAFDMGVTPRDLEKGAIVLRAGKKRFHSIQVDDS